MLKGKTALITGSTQGLGLAIAGRLAAEGCNIVPNGFGKPNKIEAARRRLEETAGASSITAPT
jgi:3-hydroxybutyrate dehydrogenase